MTILLFLFTLVVYLFSYRGEGAGWNHFIYLADSFLHGHLYITKVLTEVVTSNAHQYVVYPPMPAILLMPLVAVFGISFPQPFFSIFLGAVNVSLCYLVCIKLFQKHVAFWVSVLYGFGTIQWYHAEVGSSWYIAHIVALFFLWLMILEVISKQRLFIAGLLIGFAYLSRLPTILAFSFILFYIKEKFVYSKDKRIIFNFRNFALLGFGILPAVLFNGGYNYLRFGEFYDVGYKLLPIFNEPWYRYGLFSINYLPQHLKEFFLAPPIFTLSFPFVIPSLYVMALWFVTPVFLLIPFANFKKRLIQSSLLAMFLISIPDFLHGNNGSSQFGYRFAMDYLPFLLLLVGSALEKRFYWWTVVLIFLSVLINFWGVLMISFLNKWGM